MPEAVTAMPSLSPSLGGTIPLPYPPFCGGGPLLSTGMLPQRWLSPITNKVIGLVMKNLPTTKNPGPNGFMREFYQIFKEN